MSQLNPATLEKHALSLKKKWSEHISRNINMCICVDPNREIVEETILLPLLNQGITKSEIMFRHDCFGAPYVTVNCNFEFAKKNLLVSLSGDVALTAGFSVVADSEKIIGAGIDIAPYADFTDFAEYPESIIKEYFYSSEWKKISNAMPYQRIALITKLFSAKESAFKSMSCLYRRHKNKIIEKRIGRSILDFEIVGEIEEGYMYAIPHGYSGKLGQKINASIILTADHSPAYTLSNAICIAH